jgi:hypothetical protein
VKHGAKMSDGRKVTADFVREATEAQKGGEKARELFKQMMTSADFPEFLTLIAYDFID